MVVWAVAVPFLIWAILIGGIFGLAVLRSAI
jgi:hypothetical protein